MPKTPWFKKKEKKREGMKTEKEKKKKGKMKTENKGKRPV